jgi:hypothetical protein
VSRTFPLSIYTTDSFKVRLSSELIYWLKDQLAKSLLLLIEASKGLLKAAGKRKKTNAQMFLLQW